MGSDPELFRSPNFLLFYVSFGVFFFFAILPATEIIQIIIRSVRECEECISDYIRCIFSVSLLRTTLNFVFHAHTLVFISVDYIHLMTSLQPILMEESSFPKLIYK